MKYYSEMTKQVYDTTQELEAAEKEVLDEQKAQEEKLAKRAERAKEVEAAYAKAAEAKEQADELLNEFLKDYNSFHMSIRSPIKGIFDDIFTLF